MKPEGANTIKTIDEEVPWDKNQTIISRTDKFGTINFVNPIFCKVSGYSEAELIGKSHNVIRHPDMPKVVFKLLWNNILQGNNFHAVVKNLSRDGRYYWVVTNFTITRDPNGEIVSFLAQRNAVSPETINKHFVPLYKKLLDIEKVGGIEASEGFLNQYLQSINKTYQQFIYDAIDSDSSNNSLSKAMLGENPFLKKKDS